ncbi:MAG: sensor histidine kinase [Blastocatellia bacterium]
MLSLRAKLTVYYLAILAAVLIFFGVAIYVWLSRGLVSIIDNSLVYEAGVIARQMTTDSFDPGGLPGEEALTEDAGAEGRMVLVAQVVQIIDAEGQVRDDAGSMPKLRLPVDRRALARINGKEPVLETASAPDGELFRLATRRAVDPDGEVFFIRVGQSLKPLQETRRRVVLLLLLAVPIALLLGSYGGLLLANQALRPVDRITSAARDIQASDLSQRVPQPETRDEIGRLATTFNHMIARLEAAFARQRQFTSDASHELRTPLAVMRGEMEIALRRERPPAEYQRVLHSSLEEIARLSRLVEDLLALARADAGQAALAHDPVILDVLCQQTIVSFQPLVTERGLNLNWRQPDQPVIVAGDAQRLKQMLLNLLDNAVKYTPRDGAVTVTLNLTEDNAVLKIADTGRGIPPEDLPHVFERFFRHSRTTSDSMAAGFGLGLSIVKWIVDSHEGRIEAASEPGQGTEFTVTLPLFAPEESGQ